MKHGKYNSKFNGEIQSYYCSNCNYKFQYTPIDIEKLKENMPICSRCNQKLYVSKAGTYQSKNNGRIQKYYSRNPYLHSIENNARKP